MAPFKRERRAPDLGPYIQPDADLKKAIQLSLETNQVE